VPKRGRGDETLGDGEDWRAESGEANGTQAISSVDLATVPSEDPIVAQRRIRTYLRSLRLRSAEHKTQKQVASELDWSPVKLLRLEAGHQPVATSDLMALLTLYGITDDHEFRYWVDLARISRKPTIRDVYRDIFSKPFAEFVQHEPYASVKREYSTKLVAGVLQTEEYTAAVLRAYMGQRASQKEIDRRILARAARYEQLFGRSDEMPDLSFIIDEAVLRRQVGRELGLSNLMTRQLEHLREIGSRPKVNISIVPFTFGMYGALRGPFELLEFADPADPPMLYVENPLGDELIHEDDEAIATYLEIFTDLEDALQKDPDVNFARQLDKLISELR